VEEDKQMDSKIPVYTVLAVVLGVLLTSAVPAGLTPRQEPLFMAGSEAEAPVMKAPAEDEVLGSRADEEMDGALPGGSVKGNPLDQALQYSILVVDLFVALGVYFVARRRFA
jgi:hypothetical protein